MRPADGARPVSSQARKASAQRFLCRAVVPQTDWVTALTVDRRWRIWPVSCLAERAETRVPQSVPRPTSGPVVDPIVAGRTQPAKESLRKPSRLGGAGEPASQAAFFSNLGYLQGGGGLRARPVLHEQVFSRFQAVGDRTGMRGL